VPDHEGELTLELTPFRSREFEQDLPRAPGRRIPHTCKRRAERDCGFGRIRRQSESSAVAWEPREGLPPFGADGVGPEVPSKKNLP